MDYCKKLGCSETISYKDTPEFNTKVMQITDGKGVDIILDPVGSSFFKANSESLAMDSRWVIYGFLSGSVVD